MSDLMTRALGTLPSRKPKHPPALTDDELRALTADPDLEAARAQATEINGKLAAARVRFDELQAELNMRPNERQRAELRIRLERDETQLAIQELQRATSVAQENMRATARDLWTQKLTPALRARFIDAAKRTYAKLLLARQEDRELWRLHEFYLQLRALAPTGDIRMDPLRFVPLAEGGPVEHWLLFLSQELGITVEDLTS